MDGCVSASGCDSPGFCSKLDRSLLYPSSLPTIANLFYSLLSSPHSPLCPTCSSLTLLLYFLLPSSQQSHLCVARLSFVQSRAISLPPAIVHTGRRHLRLEISTTLRLSSPACATQSSHFT
ncbi:hypothetical protein HDV63DRAFT_208097 [Trichoderma sp. SZMC 28014]